MRTHSEEQVIALTDSANRPQSGNGWAAAYNAEVLTAEVPQVTFDAHDELQRIKQRKQLGRQRPYSQRNSKLDQYTPELLALWNEPGCRVADLQDWLCAPPRRLKVYHSTVSRWLQRTLDQRNTDLENADRD